MTKQNDSTDFIAIGAVFVIAMLFLVVWSPFIIAGALYAAVLFWKLGWGLVIGFCALVLWWLNT